MSGKKLKRAFAFASALTMLSAAAVTPVISASSQILVETDFDYKMLPWRVYETKPASQHFSIEDGALHIKIEEADGAEGAKWDLQLKYSDLIFKAGHKYKVSFDAKSSRKGLQLSSQIADKSTGSEYFVLKGTGEMVMGPSMDGEWGSPAELSTSYQTFSGTFTPTEDIEAAEWTFYYANAAILPEYGGNAKDGDEIWFDNMSIECTTCDECGGEGYTVPGIYGTVSRDSASYTDMETYIQNGKPINYISVNQLGYYPKLSKVAVLGDNSGDILYGASSIKLTEDTYDFDICDAKSGDVVYSGTSEKKMFDKDSGDNICKLDFSEFQTPGRYYIRVGDWRSFEFNIGDDIYSDSMLTNTVNFFYQNRSGSNIEKDYITSGDKSSLVRKADNKTDMAYVQKNWKTDLSTEEAETTNASSKITASGGWNDNGSYVKNVVNGGISVWTLQNMYERAVLADEAGKKFDDGSGVVVNPEAGDGVPDILNEAAYELDWMSSMVVKEDEPTWGRYAGLVYHKQQDHNFVPLSAAPYIYETDYRAVRIVKPPTFAATLNYAACAAQAARLWAQYDTEKAAGYLEAAKNAFAAYEKYSLEASEDEEVKEALLDAAFAAEDSDFDHSVNDEAYWAACEIFVSAKKMGDADADAFFDKLSGCTEAFGITSSICDEPDYSGLLSSLHYKNTASAGTLTLSLHKDLLSETDAKSVECAIVNAAEKYLEAEKEQGYGIPYRSSEYVCADVGEVPVVNNGYKKGSNSVVVNNAIIMAYAYDQTGDGKYMNGVTTAMDYLLGTNPLAFSYITGYGTYHVKNPHHNYWAREFNAVYPEAPDGVLTSGPNAGLQDEYVRGLGFIPCLEKNPSQRCYVDSVESWSTNNISVSYNSSLAWVVSFLRDEAANAEQPEKAPVSETVVYGDIDDSGSIDLTDLTMLSQYLLGDIELSEKAYKAADCDGNGKVDIADLPLLKQYVMKQEVKLGPVK